MRTLAINNTFFVKGGLSKDFAFNFYIFSKKFAIVLALMFIFSVVFYILVISYATLLGAKISSYEKAIADLKSKTASLEERILDFDRELLSSIDKYNVTDIKNKTFLKMKRTLSDAR